MPSAVVCDDDLMSRQVLRGLLVDAGFSVVGEVEMAVTALDIVSVTRPDVLILDVNLPGMTGIEILRDVALRSPETAVIVVSAYDVDHLEEEADAAAAVLSKTDLVRFDEVLKDVMRAKGETASS